MSVRNLSAAVLFLLCAFISVSCDKPNAMNAEQDEDSKKTASLQEMIEDLSGSKGAGTVPVAEVTSSTICSLVPVTGELVPERSVLVKPLMDGRIQFLRRLQVGDLVEADETLAKIDDRDIEAEIEQEEHQIEIVSEKIRLDEQDLAQRRKSLEYDLKLCEKAFITKIELERSEMEVHRAEIGLRQSQISLQQEKTRLSKALRQREKVPIVAPISGMVVLAGNLLNQTNSSNLVNEDIMALDGTLVGPNTALFGIVSQNGFTAECMVNGKDKARIAVGQQVRGTVISHRTVDITGEIVRISSLQDQKTHAYQVWIRINESDPSFTTGLFVRADIEIERHDGAIVVPREYLKERDNRKFIQLVRDGMVQDVYTTEGLTQEDRVELLGGVADHDMIVASKDIMAADQAVKTVRIDEDKEMKK